MNCDEAQQSTLKYSVNLTFSLLWFLKLLILSFMALKFNVANTVISIMDQIHHQNYYQLAV